MKLTKEQLREIKIELDNATWTGEFSHPHHVNGDEEKACNYLDTQKFSIKTIKEHIGEIDKTDLDPMPPEDLPAYIAAWIADRVAFDRVRRFLYNPRKAPGNGWYLPESWVFQIA